MFKRRTVFVIGAGASRELGLPVGDGLMSRIVDILEEDRSLHGLSNQRIVRALVARAQAESGHAWSESMEALKTSARKIREALPYSRSIDTYLESQADDERTVFVGKLLIAYSILEAEEASALSKLGMSKHQIAESWYPALARTLTAGRNLKTLDRMFDDVAFVVFNYDRCLELFLLETIRRYFGVDERVASEVLSRAPIVHAYGRVGSVMDVDPDFVPFGGNDRTDLAAVASGIKTYTESVDEGISGMIKGMVENAETLVFMGFGYLAQNMTLLAPLHGSQASEVFATAFGFSTQDKILVGAKLVDALGTEKTAWVGNRQVPAGRRESFRLQLERGTCRDLMNNNVFALADQ